MCVSLVPTQEDPEFPESLENCITLDELDEEHSEEEGSDCFMHIYFECTRFS